MTASQIYQRCSKAARSLLRRLSGNRVQKKIFFLHIPKCGGTSADAAITEAFGWTSSLHLDSAASRKAAEMHQQDLMSYRNSLLPYFMEQKDLQYISGHFTFDGNLFSHYGSEWHYITILRNPVQKYISQYFYNHQKENKDHFGIEESLQRFVESEEGIRLGQDMVQKISGMAIVTEQGSAERKKHVEQAIRNVENFHLLGILEDMERFESDFKDKFGVSLRIRRMNINPGKDQKQLSPSIISTITSLCEPDMTLYNHVRKLLYG